MLLPLFHQVIARPVYHLDEQAKTLSTVEALRLRVCHNPATN